MRYEEFADAGLLDGLDGEPRRERAELLERLVDGGVSVAQLAKASQDGRLPHLVMRDALAVRGEKYTLEQIATLSGVSLGDVERWFRAMGRGVASRTDLGYDDVDLQLAQVLVQYRRLGLDEDGLFASARVVGRNLWASADAIELLVDTRLTAAGDNLELGAQLANEVVRLAHFQSGILAHLIASRIEASTLSVEGADNKASVRELAVAFADLVGFTSLGEVAEPVELARLAERLDHLTTEVIEPPVRFVKTVGDAVMLISTDANAMARVVLRVFDAAQADGMPPLHAGIAWGPALPKAGDWIGRTVNLASRVSAVAQTGIVLLDQAMRDRLDTAAFPTEAAGTFTLKGYDGARSLYRLRR